MWFASGWHLPTPNKARRNTSFVCLEVVISQALANVNIVLMAYVVGAADRAKSVLF
jgi:hypothetical protein